MSYKKPKTRRQYQQPRPRQVRPISMGDVVAKSIDRLEGIAQEFDVRYEWEKNMKDRVRKVIVDLNEVAEFYGV